MSDANSDKSIEDMQVDFLWQHVIDGVPDLRTKLSLKQGYFICAAEAEIFLIFTSAFHHATVSTKESRGMVERAIREVFGGPYALRCPLCPKKIGNASKGISMLLGRYSWQRSLGYEWVDPIGPASHRLPVHPVLL